MPPFEKALTPSIEQQIEKLEEDLKVIQNNINELSQQESQAAISAIQGYKHNATMIGARLKALKNKNKYRV